MHKKTAVELKESHIGAKILLEIESKDFFKPIFPFLFSGFFKTQNRANVVMEDFR